nr:hypothetical protein [Caulobacter zeae]
MNRKLKIAPDKQLRQPTTPQDCRSNFHYKKIMPTDLFQRPYIWHSFNEMYYLATNARGRNSLKGSEERGRLCSINKPHGLILHLCGLAEQLAHGNLKSLGEFEQHRSRYSILPLFVLLDLLKCKAYGVAQISL